MDAQLGGLARERGVPLRRVINDALRAGIRPEPGEVSAERMPTRPLGVRPGIDLDKALSLAGELEDDDTRWPVAGSKGCSAGRGPSRWPAWSLSRSSA